MLVKQGALSPICINLQVILMPGLTMQMVARSVLLSCMCRFCLITRLVRSDCIAFGCTVRKGRVHQTAP